MELITEKKMRWNKSWKINGTHHGKKKKIEQIMEKMIWNQSRKKENWDGTNHGKNDMELITEKRKYHGKNDMEQIMEKRKLRWNKSWKKWYGTNHGKKENRTNHGTNDMELITEKNKLRWNKSWKKWYGTNHGKKKIKIEQIMEKMIWN